MHTSRHRAGFTLIDLCALLALGVLLLAVTVPVTRHARETANWVKCGSNLRQIGQAMLLYANENSGNYPRTMWVPGAPPTQYTGIDASNPFAADGPSANDVTAAAFLLLRTQDLTSSIFICPSDLAEPWDLGGKPVETKSNFPGPRYLSYSFHNMYPGPAVVAARWRWMNVDVLPADFVLAADMNPGIQAGSDPTAVRTTSSVKDMVVGNSPNHGRQGQNVLFGDGHVDHSQTCMVGIGRDNIYGPSAGVLTTVGTTVTYKPEAAAPLEAPMVHPNDSVLLPTALGKASPPAVPIPTALRLPLGLIAVALVALLALVVMFIWRSGRTRPTVSS